jgi:predicted ABC-type ATPase
MPAPKPTIYVIAGCNGAGKTTFAKEFLPTIGVIRFLNADEIARGLSPLRPEVVAFKAGKLLLSELRELTNRHENFALESTLSGRTYVKIFKEAKRRDYRIELHFSGFRTFARLSDACVKESSKVDTMFHPRISDGDLPRPVNICSMITHR